MSVINKSLPSRGAWIEIAPFMALESAFASLPSRGAWIEIEKIFLGSVMIKSLPSRGAWIEIRRGNCSLPCPPRRSPRGERG